MGGLNSGRFGRRSASLLDSECIRVRLSDLRRAGLISSRSGVRLRATPSLPVEVELNGDDRHDLRARLSIGTDTGPSSWIVRREGPHVPPADWLSDTSLFVRLTTTRPTYGGTRYWFVCPRRDCGRRCEALYHPKGCNARAFACRRCHGVRYFSQRIGAPRRAERRADRCVRRLVSNTQGDFQRPRGMHRATYTRLIGERTRFVNLAWATSSLATTLASAVDEVLRLRPLPEAARAASWRSASGRPRGRGHAALKRER